MAFGLAMSLLTPIFQAPDEGAHFCKAYQLSQGIFKPEKRAIGVSSQTGGVMPATVVAALRAGSDLNIWDQSEPGSDGRFVDFSNSAAYPPLSYVPQALAIALARRLTEDVPTLVLFGRWLNLLTGVGLTALAITRVRALRWFMFLLGLTPMTVFQFASLSPDTVTIGCAWVFLALLLEGCISRGNRPLDVRSLLPMVFCGALLGLCKQAYFPLLLGWWLIPVRRFGSWQRALAGFAVMMVATGLTFGSWAGVLRETYSPPRFGVDPKAQTRFLLEHPDLVPEIVLNSVAWGLEHARQFVGVLGMLNVPLPWALIGWQWVALVAVSLADPASQHRLGRRPSWTVHQRLGAFWLWVSNWLLLLLVLYMTWMSPGDDYVHTQGRYLLPIAPLLAIALAGLWPGGAGSWRKIRLWIGPACVGSALVMLLTALACLAEHYRSVGLL